MNKQWLLVLLAGCLEVGWVTGLKYSHTAAEWLLTILAIVISFFLLIYCSGRLPTGTVYAAFVGFGTCGTVLLGMILFQEPFNWMKMFFLAALVTGIVGLKMISSGKGESAQ